MPKGWSTVVWSILYLTWTLNLIFLGYQLHSRPMRGEEFLEEARIHKVLATRSQDGLHATKLSAASNLSLQ